MRKLFLSTLFLSSIISMSHSQELNAGLHLGLPVGDASNLYSFNLTADVSALWELGEQFEAGVITGLSFSVGDNNVDNAVFLPIAGTARYEVTEALTLGADLGYALGLTDGFDGGFYYAPRVQYDIADDLDIVLSYRAVSDNGTFSILNLGVEYEF
jgi:hypothetical protein